MSEDRLGEGGGGETLHITKKEEFSLDRLELLKTVGTGGFFENFFSPHTVDLEVFLFRLRVVFTGSGQPVSEV